MIYAALLALIAGPGWIAFFWVWKFHHRYRNDMAQLIDQLAQQPQQPQPKPQLKAISDPLSVASASQPSSVSAEKKAEEAHGVHNPSTPFFVSMPDEIKVDLSPNVASSPATPILNAPPATIIPATPTPSRSVPLFDSNEEQLSKSNTLSKMVDYARSNWIVVVGLIILFLGFSFVATLVSMVMSREMRLSLIALGAIGGLVVGWIIRQKRPSVALPLQGTAIAIFMMCVFVAFRRYEMISQVGAFVLLVAVSALLGILADLQRARSLAFFGLILGFAIPPMVSSGGGSLSGLMSYYAILHLGSIWLATRRVWPEMNLMSFVFLVLISMYWAINRYVPQELWVAQGFVVLFFTLYFYLINRGIFLHNQSSSELFDSESQISQRLRLPHFYSALTFVLPMVVAAFQFALWQDSLPVVAQIFVFYASVYFAFATKVLRWSILPSAKKTFAQALFVIGFAFAVMSVPAFFGVNATAGLWALAGLGITWFSLKQRQAHTIVLGVTLQVFSWMQVGFGTAFNASLWDEGRVVAWIWNPIVWIALLFVAILARFFWLQKHKRWAYMGAGIVHPLWGVFVAGLILMFIVDGDYHYIDPTFFYIVLSLIAVLWAWRLFGANKSLDTIWHDFNIWPWLTSSSVVLSALLPIFLGSAKHYSAMSAMLVVGGLGSAWLIHRELRRTEREIDSISSEHNDEQIAFLSMASAARPLLLGMGFFAFMVLIPPYLSALIWSWSAEQSQPQFILPWINFVWTLIWVGFAWFVGRREQWRALMALSLVVGYSLAIKVGLLFYAIVTIGIQGISWTDWMQMLVLWLVSEGLYHRLLPSSSWANEPTWQYVSVRFNDPELSRHRLAHGVNRWLICALLVVVCWQGLDYVLTERASLANTHFFFLDAVWQRHPASSLFSWVGAVWLWLAINALFLQQSLKPLRGESYLLTSPLRDDYQSKLLPLSALALMILMVYQNIIASPDMRPLPYWPLINVLDLTSLLVIFSAIRLKWVLSVKIGVKNGWAQHPRYQRMIYMTAFVALTFAVVRTLAVAFNVEWSLLSLLYSSAIQPTVSVLWAVIALTSTIIASRRVLRGLWMSGAGLLVVVILKIFILDLSSLSVLGYTFSFLAVGLLMVVIGYFSPIPPIPPKQTQH